MNNYLEYSRLEKHLVMLKEDYQGYKAGTYFTTSRWREYVPHQSTSDTDASGWFETARVAPTENMQVQCIPYANTTKHSSSTGSINIPSRILTPPIKEIKTRVVAPLPKLYKKNLEAPEYSRVLILESKGDKSWYRPSELLKISLNLDSHSWGIYQDDIDDSLFLGVSRSRSNLRSKIINKLQVTALREYGARIPVAGYNTFAANLPAIKLYRLG